jgi:hypothetical protein
MKSHQRPSRRSRLLKQRFSSTSVTGTSKNLYLSSTSLRARTQGDTHHFAGDASAPLRSTGSSETEDYSEPESAYRSRADNSTFSSRVEARTLHYASLPPSPLLPSTPSHSFSAPLPPEPEPPAPPRSRSLSPSHSSASPFSLWDYLREEIWATDFDSHQELKWDRVSNFLSIPLAMEKVTSLPYIHNIDGH